MKYSSPSGIAQVSPAAGEAGNELVAKTAGAVNVVRIAQCRSTAAARRSRRGAIRGTRGDRMPDDLHPERQDPLRPTPARTSANEICSSRSAKLGKRYCGPSCVPVGDHSGSSRKHGAAKRNSSRGGINRSVMAAFFGGGLRLHPETLRRFSCRRPAQDYGSLRDHGDRGRGAVFGQRFGHGHLRRSEQLSTNKPVDRLGRQPVADDFHPCLAADFGQFFELPLIEDEIIAPRIRSTKISRFLCSRNRLANSGCRFLRSCWPPE